MIKGELIAYKRFILLFYFYFTPKVDIFFYL